MKQEIRCKADNTLLMTLTTLPKGGTEMQIGSETVGLKSKDVPGKPGLMSVYALCPKCGAESFIGSMPKT